MSFLRSIRTKVWICVGVGFVGFLIASLSTFHSNSRLSLKMTTLGDYYFPLSRISEKVLAVFKDQTKLYENAFLLGEEDSVTEGDLLSGEVVALLDEMIALSTNNSLSPSHLKHHRQKYLDYAGRASEYYLLASKGDQERSLQRELQTIGTMREELLNLFEDHAGRVIGSVADEVAIAKEIAHKNTTFILTIFALVLVLSVFVINFVANKLLIKPLQGIQEMVRLLASGELSLPNRSRSYARDEIGKLAEAIQDMAGKLKLMVFRINDSSEAVTRISGDITEASKSVDETASLQAVEVETTSSAIMEINASVKGVGEGVDTLSESSLETTSSIMQMAACTEELAVHADSLSQSAEEVNSSITEMAMSMKQIGNSINSLKGASDTTVSSVSQMDASTREVEKNSNDAARIAEEVKRDAEAGRASVEATIAGIHQIKEASEITSGVIRNLSNQANDVGSILSVIGDLTEQTNLLALNAAIIAAQAGEHGKGFAVVASEIKELANRTSHSTKEIEQVIQNVLTDTQEAVEAIHHSERNIKEGETLSAQSGQALVKIVAGIQMVAEQMDKIAHSTGQHAVGSKTIRESMENVSTMIGQVLTATSEQQIGNDRIMDAGEQMRILTSQVKNSTREQSAAAKSVAEATENANEMIQQIKKACEEQMKGSRQIVQAVQGIQGSTEVNLGSTGMLKQAVVKLTGQTHVLQREMTNFRMTDETEMNADTEPGDASLAHAPGNKAGEDLEKDLDETREMSA